MSWRRRGAISVFVIALLSPTSVRAGTTPAPSEPSPTEPISQLSQLLNYVRKGGPEGRIVRGVSYGETTDEAKIVVSNAFHRMSYQERLQMVQEFGFTWGKINPSMNATALVVDDRGNLLGRRSPNGNIWVDR
jgi:YD repeat-containing protein